ncbi:GGDEF domain-containing protein [Lachnospira pectinoschiza]|uniref:Diguanylate cyclase (GGDEF) domain-containing protein n=1 Tax=Lachnospira pectinoschiza TaxID=28052 RepID=A0A1G9TV27_9FIRM|nr:GGDEF domain-containing protein [Lachnospira pectinoschiza]SDM51274.1 diguanylate cyclase (GGDEF) domain-containing protein [Lachnospira pectinoschiza]
MSDNTIYVDDFERSNRLNRRIATIDAYYLAIVANKPFTEYFGDTRFSNLTEFVAEEEKINLMDFIDSYEGKELKGIFHFRNHKGEMRLNLITLFAQKTSSARSEINIEMVDVESLANINELLLDDIKKGRALFGLTKEYTFTYDMSNDIFKMCRYDIFSKDTIYKMSLIQWREFMINEGFIAESDIGLFKNLVGQILSYEQSFSAKITTSMRTQKQIMEKLIFTGMVYNKYNGDKIVIGRILTDENAHTNSNLIEMISDLSYDALTGVYNKKTITEYAKSLISANNDHKHDNYMDAYPTNLAIIILDVDNFKKVNDLYGHMYGDKILARIGRKLKEIIGDGGVIGRIGGDEFLIILFDITDENLLRGYLRAVRTQIKWEFINDFADFNITCSIGSSIYPKDASNYDELFRIADFCLYIAKEKGRDRYVFYRKEIHEEAYIKSITSSDKKNVSGREVNELRYISKVIEHFARNKRQAVSDLLTHIQETFNVDSVNIYRGENLELHKTFGQVLDNSSNALYAKSPGFKSMLCEKMFLESSFVGRVADVAPEFSEAMHQRNVICTIQIVLGNDMNNITGLLTIDKAGNAPQKWAEYEIQTSLIAAYLINVLIADEDRPYLK